MEVLIWLSLGGIIAWYWASTTKAREIAIAHGRRACKEMNVQFLDGTVVRYSSKPKRGPSGQMCLCRDFSFEFTTDGANRYPGHIRLLGTHLQIMDLDYAKPDEAESNHLILNTEYRREDPPEKTSSNVIELSQFRRKPH